MTSLLLVHVPPFINSCITMSFQVQSKMFVAFWSQETRLSLRGISKTRRPLKNPQEQRPKLAIHLRTHLTLHQSRVTLVVAVFCQELRNWCINTLSTSYSRPSWQLWGVVEACSPYWPHTAEAKTHWTHHECARNHVGPAYRLHHDSRNNCKWPNIPRLHFARPWNLETYIPRTQKHLLANLKLNVSVAIGLLRPLLGSH